MLVVVQSLSCVFVTPWAAAHHWSWPFTISQSLLKLMSIDEWCHPTVSSCHPLLLLPSIIPSIRVFSKELVLPSGHQSIGASATASVLPMNIHSWFPLGLAGLIFLQSKGLSRIFSNEMVLIYKQRNKIKPRGRGWGGNGGGIGMGNTCKPMAISFHCMTKSTTNKNKKKNIPKSIII